MTSARITWRGSCANALAMLAVLVMVLAQPLGTLAAGAPAAPHRSLAPGGVLSCAQQPDQSLGREQHPGAAGFRFGCTCFRCPGADCPLLLPALPGSAGLPMPALRRVTYATLAGLPPHGMSAHPDTPPPRARA